MSDGTPIETIILDTLMEQHASGQTPRCVSVLVSVRDFWQIGQRTQARIENDYPYPPGVVTYKSLDPSVPVRSWITFFTPAGPVQVSPSSAVADNAPVFEGVSA